MKRVIGLLLVGGVALAPAAAMDFSVSGDYMEVRTADIYTGPCVANGEVNLSGKEAILAWRVRSGAWEGVDLSGLSVVAVVNASATLGDPHASPDPKKAVLVLDQRASQSQRIALANLARSMAGDLLDNVVLTETAPIQLEIEPSRAEGSLQAGEIAAFSTRGLNHEDHLCGNEIVYYPPLVDVDAVPAYAKSHWYRGDGLGRSWSSPFKRSAFVGSFVR